MHVCIYNCIYIYEMPLGSMGIPPSGSIIDMTQRRITRAPRGTLIASLPCHGAMALGISTASPGRRKLQVLMLHWNKRAIWTWRTKVQYCIWISPDRRKGQKLDWQFDNSQVGNNGHPAGILPPIVRWKSLGLRSTLQYNIPSNGWFSALQPNTNQRTPSITRAT
jgi:hypothetical protein